MNIMNKTTIFAVLFAGLLGNSGHVVGMDELPPEMLSNFAALMFAKMFDPEEQKIDVAVKKICKTSHLTDILVQEALKDLKQEQKSECLALALSQFIGTKQEAKFRELLPYCGQLKKEEILTCIALMARTNAQNLLPAFLGHVSQLDETDWLHAARIIITHKHSLDILSAAHDYYKNKLTLEEHNPVKYGIMFFLALLMDEKTTTPQQLDQLLSNQAILKIIDLRTTILVMVMAALKENNQHQTTLALHLLNHQLFTNLARNNPGALLTMIQEQLMPAAQEKPVVKEKLTELGTMAIAHIIQAQFSGRTMPGMPDHKTDGDNQAH